MPPPKYVNTPFKPCDEMRTYVRAVCAVSFYSLFLLFGKKGGNEKKTDGIHSIYFFELPDDQIFFKTSATSGRYIYPWLSPEIERESGETEISKSSYRMRNTRRPPPSPPHPVHLRRTPGSIGRPHISILRYCTPQVDFQVLSSPKPSKKTSLLHHTP